MPISEELQLDITAALDAVDSVERALTAAFTSSAEAFTATLDDALGRVDFSDVATDLADELDAAAELFAESLRTAVTDVDVTGLADDLDTAAELFAETLAGGVDTVDVQRLADDLDAAAELFGESLRSAVDDVDEVTVTVDADVSAVEDELASLDGQEISVTLDVDQVVSGLDGAARAADDAQGSFGGLGGVVDAVGFSAGLAVGEVGGLGTEASKLGGVAGAAAVGVGALATAGGLLFSNAVASTSAMQTFDLVTGQYADTLSRVDLPGFNEDLGLVARRLGDSDEPLFLAAARIFQLGEASGVAGPAVADTTEQIVGLAARAKALNPALGDVGSVTEGMVNALARGGRFAAGFGLSLTAAEIEARALADTGKTTATELSIYERAAAGAAIATERYGESIGEVFEAGAANAQANLGRIREEFGDTLEVLGAPLVVPILDLLEAANPLFVAVASSFAEVLEGAVPLAQVLVEGITPAFEGVVPLFDVAGTLLGGLASALEVIPEPLRSTALMFGLLGSGIGPLPNVLGATVRSMRDATGAAGRFGAAWRGVTTGPGGVIATAALATTAINLVQDEITRANDAADRFLGRFRASVNENVQSAEDIAAAMRHIADLRAEFADRSFLDSTWLGPLGNALNRLIQGGALDKVDDGLRDIYNGLLAQRVGAEVVAAYWGITSEQALNLALNTGGLVAVLDEAREATIELTASQAAVISGAPGLSDVFATFAAGIPSIEQFAEIMRTTGLDADLLGDVLIETRLRAQELADGFAESVVPTVAEAMSELNDEDGLAEFVATLERQAGDAANFVANIATLYARGFDELAGALLEAGPAAAGFAAEAAQASDDTLAEYEEIVGGARGLNEKTEIEVRRFGPILTDGIVTPAERAALLFNSTLIEGLPEGAREAILRAADLFGPDSPQVRGLAEQAGLSGDAVVQALESRLVEGFDPDAITNAWGVGLAAGVLAQQPRVRAAANAIAQAAVDGFRSVWEIRSPSRVAVDLAAQFTAGIAEGLDPEPVVGAVETLGAQVISSTSDWLDAVLRLARGGFALSAEVFDEYTELIARSVRSTDRDLRFLDGTIRVVADRWATTTPSVVEFGAAMELLGMSADDTAGLLAQVTREAQQLGDTAAGRFAGIQESLRGLRSTVEDEPPSLDDWSAALTRQVTEQQAFIDQITALTSQGFDDLARALLEAGPAAAGQLAAQTRDASLDTLTALEQQLEAAADQVNRQRDWARLLGADLLITTVGDLAAGTADAFLPDFESQAAAAMDAAAKTLGDPTALIAAASSTAAAVSSAFTVAMPGAPVPGGAANATTGAQVRIDKIEVNFHGSVDDPFSTADAVARSIAFHLSKLPAS